MQPARPHDESRAAQAPEWAWMAALALLTLLYFLAFFNRFAGLRSGTGEFTTGFWLLDGRLPYRDYFSATPPLNTLKSALLLKLFGPMLIVSRVAGVAERVLIATVLFAWLKRLFAVRFAFAGALVTIVVSAGDRTDPIASYNHDALLFAILSGFAASSVLEEARAAPRGLLLWSALSGVFAGVSLLTKQTVGLGAVVAVPMTVAILLLNARSVRRAALWCAGFAGGCAVPVALLAAWIYRLRMLRTFLTMTLLKGPAAKGGHASDFLLREAMVARSNAFLVVLALVAIALAARSIIRSQGHAAMRSRQGNTADLRNTACGFGATILTAELLSFTHAGTLHNLLKAAVYFVFLVTAAQVALYAALATRQPLTKRQRQFALFAAVAFFSAFFLSLSWPAFEAMTLPGLGLLIAAILDGARPTARRAVYAVLGLIVFFAVREKLDLPFAFEGVNEAPIRLETQPSHLPQLRGMRLSGSMNAFIEGAVGIIDAHTTPADTIFTYPEMSLLYALTGRSHPTFAGSHNVDVVNDAFAGEEAARLLAARPAVVIYMPRTAEEVAAEDRVWRFGRPSGQHILVRAVEQLTRGYNIAATYQVGRGIDRGDSRPVVVYVRP